MGKEFKRLKKYNALCIALKATAIGLSTGLLTAGILLVVLKLLTTGSRAIFCVLGGVALGLISGIVSFFLMKMNDKKVAERLDEVHKLNERVQTMVEFKGEEGTILTLQREDTERRLKEISSVSVRKGAVVAYVVTLCLCVGVFVGGIIAPAKAAPTEPKAEIPFELTEWQKVALKELIVYVQNSSMKEEPKTETVAKLEELLSALESGVSERQMKLMVIDSITNIYVVTDKANSNDELGAAVAALSHEQAKPLAFIIGSLNNGAFASQIEDFRIAFEDQAKLEKMIVLAEELNVALDGVLDFDETDPLYAAVKKMTAALNEVALNYPDHDAEWVKSKMGLLTNDMKIEVGAALEEQSITKDVCNHTVRELASIFKLSKDEIPADPDQPAASKPNESDDDEVNPGAPGPAEMEFGSDDTVYDPNTGEFVPYGKIMNPYYSAMDEYIHSGKVSKELGQFMSDYFQNLFAGLEEDKEN